MEAPRITITRARELRRRLSLPEVILWDGLRGRRLDGLRFRRQHPLGAYILDFYCDERKLAVEIDGASHEHPDAVRHDEARDAWLKAHGVQVLRVPATDVLKDAETVLETVRLTARS